MASDEKVEVIVKIIGGTNAKFEISPNTPVVELKKEIEEKLNVKTTDQAAKLLYKGKALADNSTLADYDFSSGGTLYLMVNKQMASTSGSEAAASKIQLQSLLLKKLLPYFSPADAKKVATEFMDDFYSSHSRYSLDDWERVATRNLTV